MYSKLPLKFIGITDQYGLRKDPITNVSTYHYGVDFGWNKYQGEPVYASNNGQIVYEGYDINLGNYVVLKYNEGNNTIINRYLHLKNRALVKTNQKVSRGDILGYMGKTGYVTGTHLHFEYWICPKNYSYKYQDRTKYAKNPLDYCYLFEDQEISKNSESLIKKVVGKPVKRNKNKKQVEVIGKELNCRSTPSLKGKILGYIDFGIYNVLESKQEDGYTWYKIEKNRWIANVKDTVKIYQIEKTQEIKQEKPKEIEKTQEIKPEEPKENKDTSNKEELNNLLVFTSEKNDYYYIYLEKGEKIYYPKQK